MFYVYCIILPLSLFEKEEPPLYPQGGAGQVTHGTVWVGRGAGEGGRHCASPKLWAGTEGIHHCTAKQATAACNECHWHYNIGSLVT